jgi:hypothetical protein
VLFFESLTEADYARLTTSWQQSGAMPADFRTRIAFVNREPTLSRIDLDEIKLRTPNLIEVQPGRFVPMVVVRLVRPVTDEQRPQIREAYPDQAEAIAANESGFEYAVPDADVDPVTKHYPASIKSMRGARVNLINIGGERYRACRRDRGCRGNSRPCWAGLREAKTRRRMCGRGGRFLGLCRRDCAFVSPMHDSMKLCRRITAPAEDHRVAGCVVDHHTFDARGAGAVGSGKIHRQRNSSAADGTRFPTASQIWAGCAVTC